MAKRAARSRGENQRPHEGNAHSESADCQSLAVPTTSSAEPDLLPPPSGFVLARLSEPGYGLWAAGRLANQLRFLLQVAALTQCEVLRTPVWQTFSDLIAAFRFLLGSRPESEQLILLAEQQRTDWELDFGCEVCAEDLVNFNRELNQHWRDDPSPLRPLLDSFVEGSTGWYTDWVNRFARLLPIQDRRWFNLGSRLDQLVRGEPAHACMATAVSDTPIQKYWFLELAEAGFRVFAMANSGPSRLFTALKPTREHCCLVLADAAAAGVSDALPLEGEDSCCVVACLEELVLRHLAASCAKLRLRRSLIPLEVQCRRLICKMVIAPWLSGPIRARTTPGNSP